LIDNFNIVRITRVEKWAFGMEKFTDVYDITEK
jgi:hypothetical protein